jgi:hypothetical protein
MLKMVKYSQDIVSIVSGIRPDFLH